MTAVFAMRRYCTSFNHCRQDGIFAIRYLYRCLFLALISLKNSLSLAILENTCTITPFHFYFMGSLDDGSSSVQSSVLDALSAPPATVATSANVLENRSRVPLVVPEDVKRKVGDVSAHVQDRLETELIAQAVDVWKDLQIKLIQSFEELNVPGSPQRVPLIGPQRFPLEDFLRDALDQVGSALMTMGAARITDLNGSLAEVSLGFDRQAVPGNAEPRNLLRLLQIIERVRRLTDEDASKRVAYVAQLQTLEAQKLQLVEKRKGIVGGNHTNDPILRDIDRDILRNDAEAAKLRTAIINIDNSKLIPSLTALTGKMLNAPYQPGRLSETVASFVQAVREVPLVASRVSPKELDKLPGDISLQVKVDLPKPPEKAVELPRPITPSQPLSSSRPLKRHPVSSKLQPKSDYLRREVSLLKARYPDVQIVVLDTNEMMQGSKKIGLSPFDQHGKPRPQEEIVIDLCNYAEAHLDEYALVYGEPLPIPSILKVEFMVDGYIVTINDRPCGSFSLDLRKVPIDAAIRMVQSLR